MIFKKGNKIKYGQDFSYHTGVPDGIDFQVASFCNDKYTLTADGYGDLTKKNNYGNGVLYVYGLTKAQKTRFNKFVNKPVKPKKLPIAPSKVVTLECLKLALERAQIPKEYKAEIVGSKIIISLRRNK